MALFAPQHGRLEVVDDHNRPSDKLLGLIMFADARNDLLGLLAANVHLEQEELVRVGMRLGLEHLGRPQFGPFEIVNRNVFRHNWLSPYMN